jgi:hypothetical protein
MLGPASCAGRQAAHLLVRVAHTDREGRSKVVGIIGLLVTVILIILLLRLL